MVNVDFASPSLLLGTALIGTGVLLLNMRNFQYKVSRDADIVVAAMVSIVGSTLIFQGWRLDPLLLLCQALTTSVAFWYGLETFRLRSKEADMTPPQLPPGMGADPMSLDAQQQATQQYYQQQMGFPPGGAPFLPPPGADTPYYPWGNTAAPGAAGQPDQQPPYGMGYGSPYGETIQYDYYGNPILPPQQMQQQQPEMAGGYDSAASTSGMPYGASAPVPPTYGGALGVDQAGYYGGAGVPPTGPAGPYDGQPAYGAGPGPASGVGGESWPGAGGYGAAPAGPGVSGAAASGYSAGQQPSTAAGPSGQGQFALPPPASVGGAGLGLGSLGAAGRRPAGRLDLHEKVDDWE
ncbi:hypothetical protein HYH02_003598 [Chlamydomonas schloesseri]|uniref:Uncharacterized protein n=1 Tax=Chlamydomonas schloesseri TaxID=2026947 RepID=A0A836B9J1_9CHLO|nr:hypothetical protein HYH02_003598 [Chlamydomonas schloesseri]|eukprot:KAG2451822.1 hypothetical protein HYH02_003598 [Chlamydomonas schloesseri]